MKSIAFASVVACFLLSIETAHGFGFGALGGGCGCAPPPPPPCLPQLPPISLPQLPCPPPPPCLPQLPPISLPQLPCPPPLPSPCGCGRKKRDAETEVVSNGRQLCTSEKLHQILLENISASATESKTNIQKAAVSKLAGNFEVICEKIDFDLVVKSKDFCQESAHEVTCYIYRQL